MQQELNFIIDPFNNPMAVPSGIWQRQVNHNGSKTKINVDFVY